MRPDRDERGFSLLELVAVLAIYSVLAILTVQLLSNAAISRTQISESVVSVTEAAAAAAVLRRDLEHLSPASGAQPPRFGDATAVEKMAKKVLKQFSSVEVLVNAAGRHLNKLG